MAADSKVFAKLIRDEIVTERGTLWAVFDPASRRSFITKANAQRFGLKALDLKEPITTSIYGQQQIARQELDMEGHLHGLRVVLHLYIVDEIGTDEKGRKIDMLCGVLVMEKHGIKLDMANKKLDLSRFQA